jgi:hypothetical protein
MFQLPQKEIDFQEKEKIVEGMFEFTEIRV